MTGIIDTTATQIPTGHGPHGGTWVRTTAGLTEVSVFETGVPPHFRLFFFNSDARPLPPTPATVTLETKRPDGERRVFNFVRKDGYLQSTSDIPEPLEFDVTLHIADDGQPQEYHTKFTEEGHSHGPGGHSHGTGVLGWLRGTFAHSHSIVDKVDHSMESNVRGIWALKIGLLGLGATAIFQLAIVLVSHSVGLLADTIHNFADAGTSIPLWIAFSLALRGASRRFTYGYGKTEDVAGVVIVLIIFGSACVAAYESVMKIIHPQPVHHLWWAAAAALVGFFGNEAVAVFRIRVGKEIGSAALVADGQHARIDGFTSLAVLVGLIGVYLGFPILDPIIGVVITIAILFIVKDAALSIWTRLIDGIEPEILSEIEHAPLHITGVRGVHDVRARWIGHKVHTDLAIDVDPSVSVLDADAISRRVEQSLREHIRLLGGAVVRVRPAVTQ